MPGTAQRIHGVSRQRGGVKGSAAIVGRSPATKSTLRSRSTRNGNGEKEVRRVPGCAASAVHFCCTRMQPTLLVLAAGMGSRYGGLKQIDPVGPAGETVLDYSIFDAIRAGFEKLVFVIRKDKI